MNELLMKSLESAADLAKQLITLATGILALTVTFIKELNLRTAKRDRNLLIFAWPIYLFSILFGILTLMAVTGSQQSVGKQLTKLRYYGSVEPAQLPETLPPAPGNTKGPIEVPPSVTLIETLGDSARIPAALQILTFLGASVLMIIFGINALKGNRNGQQ